MNGQETDSRPADDTEGMALRRLIMGANLVVLLFFSGFFLATYTTPQFARDMARDYAVEKTADYAQPRIDELEIYLKTHAPSELHGANATKTLRDELLQFTEDPKAYVLALADAGSAIPQPDASRSVTNVFKNFTKDPITTFKQEARAYYFSTVAALIQDLRIFSGTNVIASLVALLVAYSARRKLLVPLLLISAVLLWSLTINIYGYIDSMTFFRILTHTHMGMFYPTIMAILTLYILIRVFLEAILHGSLETLRKKLT